MAKHVLIEHAQIFSAMGNLGDTVESLSAGHCALQPGPCFGVDSAYAPFVDERLRNVEFCAQSMAAQLPATIAPNPTLFINCSAKGDIHCLEEVVLGTRSTIDISPLVDEQAAIAVRALGLRPARVMSISNACASGAVAIETAKELLEEGRCSHAVIFGIESICRFVATGFNSLAALSPDGARPFDARRNGLSLGEAAALAVLSYREMRSGDIAIAGAGSSNDANHRTGPSRTGEGLRRAAQAALLDAGLGPDSIGAIKCHGTATAYNDAMEAKAIYAIFGDTCPPCASFKGALGHCSGAGSLAEILIAAQCLRHRRMAPTARYEHHGVDEPLPIISAARQIEKPSVLCLSAGFGGVNAAVVLRGEMQ